MGFQMGMKRRVNSRWDGDAIKSAYEVRILCLCLYCICMAWRSIMLWRRKVATSLPSVAIQ